MNAITRKYLNKRVNATKAGIPFFLSFEEYCSLLKEAGITVDQIGHKKFHLSRKQDRGSYCIGNCSFVHYSINLKEKRISEKLRISASNNIKKIMLAATIEQKRLWRSKGGKESGKVNKIGERTKLKQEEVLSRLSKINKIDLYKFGWVQKVADILGVSHTQARRFVSKYHDGKSYMRKTR